ncbi:MAG: response regulator [Pseudohongiellaceae bacterium]
MQLSTNPPMFIISGTEEDAHVNRPFIEQLMLSETEFAAKPLLSHIHPDDQPAVAKAIEAEAGELLARIHNQQGEWITFELKIKKQKDSVSVLGRWHISPEPKETSTSENEIGETSELKRTMESMARVVEAKNPGMKCSILLVDRNKGEVSDGAGPSLPQEYNDAVHGLKIGPKVGSCGTASFWNVPVIVEDIAKDPLWTELRETAAIAGVASCWSHPVTSSEGEVLGAMALYNSKPCAPEKHHMDGLEIASRMVGMAIERDKMEQQLRHASKMEAIGLLAGGIAHDFNNILVTILGNAELALSILPEDSKAAGMLENVITGSLAASELCDQMLGYAGKKATATEPLDCNALVTEISNLSRVALSKKIDLHLDLCEEPTGVRGDRSQLGQVIMNLIRNAAESIENEQGKITIGSRVEHIGKKELLALNLANNMPVGSYVRVWISDTGCGMTDEIKAKIFDPFYTTKTTGKGLGLAAVQGIVHGHRGQLSVSSTQGNGTTFTLLLPLAQWKSDTNLTSEHSPEPKTARILVVDDEKLVQDVLVATLENAGYITLQANDGEEAISIFKREADTLDCVLLDLSMPKLDGEEVFRELQRIKPGAKVILCSGYATQDVLDRFHGANLAGVLKKPTRANVLLEKISDVLDKPLEIKDC